MTDEPAPWPDVLTPLGLEFGMKGCALPFAVVRQLATMGVPPQFLSQLTGASDLARARVALGDHGMFDWDGDQIALLLAVREEGAVIDVCAIRSAEPDDWHLLTGAGQVLGDVWLRAARIGTVSTVRIFGNPFEWLRGGGAGLCVLDWSAETVGSLRSLGNGVMLLCDDDAAAERLRHILTWGDLPIVQGVKGRIAA